MRTWPKLLIGGLALTIGLIACFAPGADVVDVAAAWLPADTPALVVVKAPDALLSELARVTEVEALAPDRWRRSGLDPTAPLTLARLPGEGSLWVMSVAVADEAIAATAVADLLDELVAAHHQVVDANRVHALLSFEVPEREAWEDAITLISPTSATRRLSEVETLEPLGTDAWMVHADLERLSDALAGPAWARALTPMLGACTLRGGAEEEAWTVDVTCPLSTRSALADLLSGSGADLTVSGEDAPVVGHMSVDPTTFARVWRTLAAEDADLDGLHSALLDVAHDAGISGSLSWHEALTGEVAVAVTRWPQGRRRLGLVGSVGVADVDLAEQLLVAARELAQGTPGVRVESERVAGHDGWTVEWLRHRGHDLSVALGDGRLWFGHGAADLEDALNASEGEAYEPGPGEASARVSLGELLDLEGQLGDLTLDVSAGDAGLQLEMEIARPAQGPALAGLLEAARDLLVARAREALVAQLSAVCDAIDLHAIDHGLPRTLDLVTVAAVDPWGQPLDYVQPAERQRHHRYDLCSRGPDGVPGSTDDVCYE